MHVAPRSQGRRWFEVVLPVYALAVLIFYFHPEYLPIGLDDRMMDSPMPWAIWGIAGALGGVLALSGLFVAFFLLYSPVYLLAKSGVLVGSGGWVDRREVRFYAGCFVILCFLAGLAAYDPVFAAAAFVVIAGCAHLIWRLLV
ncbi:MAG TPA: hypothetical protein VMT79_21280 [Candidatus Binatia bacterium]|nr:hypothetical protein [Candidatus Binatia bacterium]